MPAIPHRLTAKDAHLRVGLANIDDYYSYTPPSGDAAWDALPIFGPVRDIEIDVPTDKVDQTAGGDSGHHEIFTRQGLWTIRVAAFQDAAAVFGDSRVSELNGQYVNVLVLNAVGFYVGRALGKMEFRVTMPATPGETIVRDVVISRFVGSAIGDFEWADIATGEFA